jgi:hypothetical protein
LFLRFHKRVGITAYRREGEPSRASSAYRRRYKLFTPAISS